MGISLKEVAYSYEPKKKGTIYAIKNVNLEIASKGESIAIIGETGSGKSTLVTMMNALKVPTEGLSTIDGVEIKKVRKKKDNYDLLRKHVGLVFQFSDSQLFEETILKDVMFAPLNFGKTKEEAEQIAKKSLSLVHIDESYYSKSPFQLSGGEKKLVSIAGILAMEPDIIIFDEPTAGIDPVTKRALLDLFKELNEKEGKSIILICHDMNIVYELSKRVLVLKDRTIAFDGEPYDLFMNHKDLVKEASIDIPDCLKLMDLLESVTDKRYDRHINTVEKLSMEVLHG